MFGCYGNTEVHTPHIDRLAQTGVRFAQSFSCSPMDCDQAPFAAAGYNTSRARTAEEAGQFLDAQAAGEAVSS